MAISYLLTYPNMKLKLRGIVTSKRKRADKTNHISVKPLHVESDESRSDIEGIHRPIQCVCNHTVDIMPCIGQIDIMSLITTSSYVEGIGETLDSASDSSRLHVQVHSIRLLRVAPSPDQVMKVVKFAREMLPESGSLSPCVMEDCTLALSQLISPNFSVDNWNDNAGRDCLDYLSPLLTGTMTIKRHCHAMFDYSSSESRDAAKSSSTDAYSRPPRKRVRKVSKIEQCLLEWYELELFKSISEDMNERLLVRCGGEEGCTDNWTDDAVGFAPPASTQVPCNLPGGDVSAPSARGRLSRGEYLHGKKEPQVRWVVHRVMKLIGVGVDDRESDLRMPVHIVDVGGGRGDLAVGLALAMRSHGVSGRVTVVDTNKASLAGGVEYARVTGVDDLISFTEADFHAYQPSTVADEAVVVVALHACGHLTDLALEYACRNAAGFVIVPCCFSKIVASEWCGGWCDDLRRATECSATEQNVNDNPLSSLKWRDRLEIIGKCAESEPRCFSWRTMKAVNTMRLLCILRSSGELCRENISKCWTLYLESFSRNYSLRNMVLCGDYS